MADFTALKNSIRNYIKQNGNAEITGEVLQNILISMVVSMGDGAINGIADGLANEGNARTNADGLLQNAINSISTALGDGYTYAGIATPATTPTSGRVFYLALQAGTYTNFGGIVVTQGINILKNNDGTWQLDNVIGIDDIPTAGSPNLVKSGGAFANMGAFDISDYNKSGSTLATYADLTAALAALPSEYQKGGMSVKFIQSSDNKYVRYNLLADSFTANISQWAIDDVGVYVENPEFIEAKTDSEGKLLEARKADGTKIEYCDLQVEGNIINEGIQTAIQDMQEEVEEVEETLSYFESIESPEWLQVTTDSAGRVLGGRDKEGKVKEYMPLEVLELEAEEVNAGTLNLSQEGIDNLKEDLGISTETSDILRLNKEAKNILPQLIMPYTYGRSPYSVFSIAYMSDVHNRTINMQRFMQFCEEYSEYIDVKFHAGDTVREVLNTNNNVMEDAGASTVLNALGNHDIAYKTSEMERIDWGYYKETVERRREVYNHIIGRFISDWGNIIQPANAQTDGLCYYYKDFPEKKIRLIVLDCMESDEYMTAQMQWLEDILGGMLEETNSAFGYSVIIGQHYIPCTNSQFTYLKCNFTSIIPVNDFGPNQALLNHVDNFIQSGGNFVCYLTGHIHIDYAGYITVNNRKQFLLSIATASGSYGSGKDVVVVDGTKSQDCFDIVGIDTSLKLLKLYRIGVDTDLTLRDKNTICFDYINCEEIK